MENKLLSKSEASEIEEKAKDDVERSVAYAENECTEPSVDTLYEDIYANGEVIK